VVFEDQQLSYRELNERANQLACWLRREKGVGPDKLVGLCLERSLDMVIGIVAILKAGGAYVPLDPGYPAQRLAYMLDDAHLDVVLTHTALLASTPLQPGQAVCLDDAALRATLAGLPSDNAKVKGLDAHSLAYAIYTSGSTGNPKASLLAHEGLCNLATAQAALLDVQPSDRVLQFASIAFDGATWEWCMALANGAALVLVPADVAMSPHELTRRVQWHGVTQAALAPVLLPMLDPQQWSSVRALVVGGDVCSVQQAERWSTGRRFINSYGPSEVTVCASNGAYLPGQGRLHIGKAMPNVQLYVLSEQRALLPLGVAGELYVGGVGLARGYLNRPQLTAEKFVDHPFQPGERLYRTGDLVRWLPDGNLEFVGRIDQQVKIRGVRIELGEIEAALTAYDGVSDAAVIARQNAAGDKQLVAYVVATAGIDALRAHVSAILPAHMLPSAFVPLDTLPLTPNGKVNRKALPDPDLADQRAEYVAPQTVTETALCVIWEGILGLTQVGVTDNFFQLGGDSLLLMRMLAMVETRFGTELSIKMLFDIHKLQELAAYLDVSSPAAAASRVSGEEMESFQL
jgi:amino acid adenylation domain-containing protein